MRDHGGNIDWAVSHFGGAQENWIDLSTGINRVPYPIPPLPTDIWQKLPTRQATEGLIAAAQAAYGTSAPMLPVAGAQAAIQMLPTVIETGHARVLAPTYNEHRASLLSAGWQVQDVSTLGQLEGAELAVVVNPNNPDGNRYSPETLLELAKTVGTLIVDESFADPQPDLSLAADAGRDGLFVLRSFGKFYGLAGLRLGFILGPKAALARLSELAGPWPISGPAIEIGRLALADKTWAARTTERLRNEAAIMDDIATKAGWTLVGGTELFRLYDTSSAEEAQKTLAQNQIWSRIFPWSPTLIRLGLPGPINEWDRLKEALS
ncbi:threonine-phosphate decarboxylase CobD [Actibacterium pelagium]|uniref:threonine-phosphate decarboxylase n=1 Tax=Actibacterium pelagium TaxID=2029103 RepID=A0A917ALK6_9RHOB|nr:threonine-phosphate decarboxylase CobD [Actibacterium pelagium]GGE60648.1 threonine-phosphate decarboxylase [Actibacterium pelagium]